METLKVSNAIDKIGKDATLTDVGKLAQRRMTETERLKVVKGLDGAGRYADDSERDSPRLLNKPCIKRHPWNLPTPPAHWPTQEIRTYYRNLSG